MQVPDITKNFPDLRKQNIHEILKDWVKKCDGRKNKN